jgi:hypothetical protein
MRCVTVSDHGHTNAAARVGSRSTITDMMGGPPSMQSRRKRRWLVYVLATLLGLMAVDGILVLSGAEDEGFTENSVHIDRSPEVVFDYAADMRHELEWNPDVQSMEKSTDGPVGLGTRFAAKWKQSDAVTVECTRFEKPTALTLQNGGSLEATVAVTIRPQGTGSLFTSRFTARPHGFLKALFPVFKLRMARFEKANMDYLKKALEGQAR